jgi:hypothetical protein
VEGKEVEAAQGGGPFRLTARDASPDAAMKAAAQALRREVLRTGMVRPGAYRHHSVPCPCNVVRVAVRQDDLKVVVVYEYADTGNVWEHTLEEFLAVMPDGKQRFVPVEGSDAAVPKEGDGR